MDKEREALMKEVPLGITKYELEQILGVPDDRTPCHSYDNWNFFFKEGRLSLVGYFKDRGFVVVKGNSEGKKVREHETT